MLLLLTTIDKEERQTVNTQKDDSYHKISHTTHIGRDLRSQGLRQGQGQGLTSLGRYVGKCEVYLAGLLQCCTVHVVQTADRPYTNVFISCRRVKLSHTCPNAFHPSSVMRVVGSFLQKHKLNGLPHRIYVVLGQRGPYVTQVQNDRYATMSERCRKQ